MRRTRHSNRLEHNTSLSKTSILTLWPSTNKRYQVYLARYPVLRSRLTIFRKLDRHLNCHWESVKSIYRLPSMKSTEMLLYCEDLLSRNSLPTMNKPSANKSTTSLQLLKSSMLFWYNFHRSEVEWVSSTNRFILRWNRTWRYLDYEGYPGWEDHEATHT